MSIIHDALKKVQQGQSTKPAPEATEPKPNSGYLYSQDKLPDPQEPVEQLAPGKNKAKSLLTFIGSMALIIGAFLFLFRQINTYFPNFSNVESLVKTSFLKLIHQDTPPPPPPAVPLAKIVVAPKPQPVTAAVAAAAKPANNIPVIIHNELPAASETLNVHGVMSEGSQNVALIDDNVYQEGDTVDGVKIIKINLDYIIVDNNGTQQTIPVRSHTK